MRQNAALCGNYGQVSAILFLTNNFTLYQAKKKTSDQSKFNVFTVDKKSESKGILYWEGCKMLWEKKKMLVTSILFFFPLCLHKPQGCQKSGTLVLGHTETDQQRKVLVQGPYSQTILKTILFLFPQDLQIGM